VKGYKGNLVINESRVAVRPIRETNFIDGNYLHTRYCDLIPGVDTQGLGPKRNGPNPSFRCVSPRFDVNGRGMGTAALCIPFLHGHFSVLEFANLDDSSTKGREPRKPCLIKNPSLSV
jgi:hypothetical protein